MRLYGSQAISLLPPVGQQFIYFYPLQLLPTTFPIIHPLPPYSRHYLSHIQPLHLVQFWVSQSRPSMRHFTLLELSPLRDKTHETFHGIYQKRFDTPTIITHEEGSGETCRQRRGLPVPPLSDYLGTHQCSKNAKLGGFSTEFECPQIWKKGCFYSLEFAELRIRGGFSK